MALFHINRYLGDENDADQTSSESRSKVLLARLQEQARIRQQQNSVLQEDDRPSPHTPSKKKISRREKDENSDLHETKKKKKEEVNQEGKIRTDSPDTSDQGENCSSLKKKKKELETEQTTSVEPNKSAKKRKQEDRQQDPDPSHHLEGGEKLDVSQHEDEHTEVTKEHPDQSRQTSEQKTDSDFTILGGFASKPVQKVQVVLPQWLAQPDVVQRDINKNLVPIRHVTGICPQLLAKLESNGIHHFFPVQAEVIPAILEGVGDGLLVGRGGYWPRDICVSAPTGSGKTLAFVIPIIQALLKRVVCEIRVLVVLPTKELAQQVGKVFHCYTEGTGLKVGMVTGQRSLAAEQTSILERSGCGWRSLADIIVATPGRLVDHINMTEGFSLQHLRFLIIDEADRMIDSMHHVWLSQLTKVVYSGSDKGFIFRRTEPGAITAANQLQPQIPLQKLLFSATLTQNPEKLQRLGLYQPRLFSSTHCFPLDLEPGPQDRFIFPEGLTQYYVSCTLRKKPLLILHFILRLKFSPVLCFTNSREVAHRLYLLVKLFGGIQVAEFSSQLSPTERKRALKDFEQGKIQLLISTDAAARGIDIEGVKCVVNYDAPQFIRTYIHRVGRTARAGKAGLAFTFLLEIQEKLFLQMLKDAGSPEIHKQIIKAENFTVLEPHYEKSLLELKKITKEEKAKKKHI
ncbi:ATP-dependent RNA helicase DDX51 [Arapaima gigas]